MRYKSNQLRHTGSIRNPYNQVLQTVVQFLVYRTHYVLHALFHLQASAMPGKHLFTTVSPQATPKIVSKTIKQLHFLSCPFWLDCLIILCTQIKYNANTITVFGQYHVQAPFHYCNTWAIWIMYTAYKHQRCI